MGRLKMIIQMVMMKYHKGLLQVHRKTVELVVRTLQLQRKTVELVFKT